MCEADILGDPPRVRVRYGRTIPLPDDAPLSDLMTLEQADQCIALLNRAWFVAEIADQPERSEP